MTKHPLECICSHDTEPFQLKFAQQATGLLPLRPDCSFETSHKGLLVRGETEASVTGVIEVLRRAYGEHLSVGEFTIRYRHGPVVEEPHMGVRVLCSASHFDAVREDLISRGAVIVDAEVMHPIGVLRATASLAKLLGYSRDLAALTGAKAREVIWFSHYAPIRTAPPDGSAA